jgi:hypothetical protein
MKKPILANLFLFFLVVGGLVLNIGDGPDAGLGLSVGLAMIAIAHGVALLLTGALAFFLKKPSLIYFAPFLAVCAFFAVQWLFQQPWF